MGILELSLVLTRKIMSGFVEFIVACHRDTLLVLLMLNAVYQQYRFTFYLCSVRSRRISWIWCKCRVHIIRYICVVTAVWK